jgi:CubicO group peptidase (beta-lactamase class C family)
VVPLDDDVDGDRLGAVVGDAFRDQPTAELATTRALLVVHRGRLVSETYGPGTDAASTLRSWSIAKSILHALVGTVVADGLLELHEPVPVPEWSGPGDPRGLITLDHLLRMSSGLAFREDYTDGERSDVIEMLWGTGQSDMGAFAAGFASVAAPATQFSYSSGTSNIISRILGDVLGGEGPVRARLQERIFDPLGMASARAEFDASGTFVGSSFVYATALDFARFGLLYLRGGKVDGRHVLPAWWVDQGRTRTSLQTGVGEYDYGAHWWLTDPATGLFQASGYDGQRIMIAPDRDLVLVRLGETPADLAPRLNTHIDELLSVFPRRATAEA